MIINGFTVDKIDVCKATYPQTMLNFTIANEVLNEVCDTFNCTVDNVKNHLYREIEVIYARRAYIYLIKQIIQIKEPFIALFLSCHIATVRRSWKYNRTMLKDLDKNIQNEVFYREYYPKLKLLIEKIEKHVNK